MNSTTTNEAEISSGGYNTTSLRMHGRFHVSIMDSFPDTLLTTPEEHMQVPYQIL
jgi:hypothetical protein